MPEFKRLAIPDVILVTPVRYRDPRGYFCETYEARAYKEAGIGADFMQDNESLSMEVGTLRGLHFQTPPFTQAKLVRAVRGALFDVAVDLRKGSPTFGQWAGATLTGEGGEQLYVPRGFAHGFLTLEPETLVNYKVDAPYARANDAGISWSDPTLDIAWPLNGREPVLSDKDRALPNLSAYESPFTL